jgi:hypothetical protein
VYKVQHQLHRKGQGDGSVAAPRNVFLPVATGPLPWSEVEPENVRPRQQAEDLDDELQFDDDDDDELEAEVQTLRERVKVLEAEAVAAGQLRQRVKELEVQLGRSNLTHVIMRQDTDQLRQKFAAEQVARQKAEGQTVTEVKGLRPLKVWEGHPCCVCEKPTDGKVDQETAAHLMQHTGHKDCLLKAGLRRSRGFLDLIDKRSTVLSDKHRDG